MAVNVPLEVWFLIADHLRQVELPSLLLVSRIHRIVALKRLFNHLQVCFTYPRAANTSHSLLEGTHDGTISEAWDKLSRVRFDKTFASVIQRVTFYYSTEKLRSVDCFHNGVIVEALKALKDLRSFAWVGNGAPLMDILEKLPVCCPKLQEVSMTYVLFLSPNVCNHPSAYRLLIVSTTRRLSSTRRLSLQG